ncbi:hypothetical protein L6452_39844 [Arctium lappa]|uniref:Uncharacterized protein n=1 Tax=Arctium lappa TaxID=4217 RepID=A0ACB8XTG1_ARCLA|nr:hypothetical protein L6452_39844 [Arctium lappa]
MRLGDVDNEPKVMTGRKIEKEHTVDMGLQSVRCGVLFTGLCVSGGDQFGRSARCLGTALRGYCKEQGGIDTIAIGRLGKVYVVQDSSNKRHLDRAGSTRGFARGLSTVKLGAVSCF